MSAKNLSSVTTDAIESYGNAAKNVIQAYRLGNHRVAAYVDQSWEKALNRTASQLRSEVRKNALTAQKTISGMYVRGIVVTSDSADVVVSKVVELAGKGVHQVAVNASQFEKRTGVKALNSIAKAAVPAAIVVSGLADKLEQGSSRLANSVAGKKSGVRVATVKRVTPAKKTRVVQARKTATTGATTTKAKAKAAAPRKQRATTRAKKAV